MRSVRRRARCAVSCSPRRVLVLALVLALTLAGCPATEAVPPRDAGADARARDAAVLADAAVADAPASDAGPIATDPWARGPSLGARRHPSGDVEIRVRAPGATRVEVCFFAVALGESERLRLPLVATGDRFELRVSRADLEAAGLDAPLYYGLRVWGPNWPFDPTWSPGSELGRLADVDADGYRMNPNKLLLDPYALEISHDPIGPDHTDGRVFETTAESRAIDSAPFAPKGIVIDLPASPRAGPGHAMRDQIVYEVHLRGLTAADTSLSDAAGTYEGARARARSLRELGVTAVELLPLHETPNDQNELTADAAGDNYWGYSTLGYFAPDRHYARDRSAGGPTRELVDMIDAFHAEGLEVWVDVVYNHTAEGGSRLYSFRGISNPSYYELAADASRYVNGNGVGANFNTATELGADLVLDSLRYWHDVLGVDGFRFDLASIVGNACTRDCYRFETGGILTRIADELPARDPDGGGGAQLVAEPWGLAAGSYRLGQFPDGWAEWNDRFRDTIRRDLNRLGVDAVTPHDLARVIEGSPALFGARGPSASLNFVVAHDGFTLADLFTYDTKQNDQAWPWGPSSGGSDANLSWSHGGELPRQRLAARTALALLLVSAGVPMIVGGDEHLRTQRGNNNPYNLDSPATWLDPDGATAEPQFSTFTTRLFAFRRAHASLRPSSALSTTIDLDGDGAPPLRWLTDTGAPVSAAYFDAPDRHFLGWALDADELGETDRAIYVAYNGWSGDVSVRVPDPPSGAAWSVFADTSIAAESWSNAYPLDALVPLDSTSLTLPGRALLILVAR